MKLARIGNLLTTVALSVIALFLQPSQCCNFAISDSADESQAFSGHRIDFDPANNLYYMARRQGSIIQFDQFGRVLFARRANVYAKIEGVHIFGEPSSNLWAYGEIYKGGPNGEPCGFLAAFDSSMNALVTSRLPNVKELVAGAPDNGGAAFFLGASTSG